MNPLVSIIIPCYNEEKYIEECVNSLLFNDYPSKRIIIIDGGSTDGTTTILKLLKDINQDLVILQNPAKITPISLNLGIAEASGDYIMIASSHATFPENYISEIMRHFKIEEESIALIGGLIKTEARSQTGKSAAIRKVLSSRWGVGNSHFRTGISKPTYVDTVPFGIYKRKVLEELGGYNECLVRNHDIELNKRIINTGRQILLIPMVTCNYYARENYRELWINNFKNGYWNINTLLITREFKSLSLRHYIPLLFLLSIIIPPIIYIFTSIEGLLLISIIVLVVYNLLIIIQSIKNVDRTTKIIYLLFGYITLHFSYGFGSLVATTNFGIIFKKKQ